MNYLKTNLLVSSVLYLSLSAAQATDYFCPATENYQHWVIENAHKKNDHGIPLYKWSSEYKGPHKWGNLTRLEFLSTHSTGHVRVIPQEIMKVQAQVTDILLCTVIIEAEGVPHKGIKGTLVPRENHCTINERDFSATCEDKKK